MALRKNEGMANRIITLICLAVILGCCNKSAGPAIKQDPSKSIGMTAEYVELVGTKTVSTTMGPHIAIDYVLYSITDPKEFRGRKIEISAKCPNQLSMDEKSLIRFKISRERILKDGPEKTIRVTIADIDMVPDGIVLTADHGERLLQQCSRPAPTNITEFYNLTDQQFKVIKMDIPGLTNIESYISTNSVRVIQLVEDEAHYPAVNISEGFNPTDSFFQCVGFIRDGNKYAYVNAFPRYICEEKDYRKSVNICDGGAFFWGAVYDFEKGRFVELEFNGGL